MHEMRPGTVRRVGRAAGMAMTFATIIYSSAGIAGMISFGGDTNSDILVNFDPTNHVYMIIAYLGVAFTITFSFPVMLFPMRDAVLQVLKIGTVYSATTLQRVAVAGTIAASSLLIGLFVQQIATVFALTGGICGSSLAFSFPGLFALRTGAVTRERSGMLLYVATWAVFVGGVVAGVFGTGVSIYAMFTGSSSTAHRHRRRHLTPRNRLTLHS